MKVLTLNTHAWMEEESYDKIEKIIDRILAKDYTFIALQEINQSIEAEEVEDPGFIQPKAMILVSVLKLIILPCSL